MRAGEFYHLREGVLRRKGRSDIQPPSSGNKMVYGIDLPGPGNTGHLGTLTDLGTPATDVAVLPNGVSEISDRRIFGDINWKGGTDLTLRNCLLVGGTNIPSGASAVVNCNSAHGGRLTLIDCTVVPREPRNRDCIVGHKWSAYRCDLSNSVDGMGIFITSANGTKADVVAMGNYVHDLAYIYPDYRNGVSGSTWHTDGSHNDGAHLQGGNNVHLKGNFFDLSNSNPAPSNTGPNPEKPWMSKLGYTNGSATIVQSNTGTPIDNTVIIEENWYRGGLSQLNVKPNMQFIFRNNRHYTETAVNTTGEGGAWNGYWIRIDQKSGTVITSLNTNRWADGTRAGQVLAEPRASGIHYNA